MHTYVLQLAEGRIYCGRTTNLHKRLRAHWRGKGAKWTRLFPPHSLLEVLPTDVEVETTLRYFRSHGLLVRGGPWVATRLSAVPRCISQEEMATTLATQTDISQWTIQPPVRNSHNSLVWPITVTKDSRAHPRVQVGKDDANSLRIPFGASRFSENSKTALDYSIAPWQGDILEFFEKVDNMVLDYVFAHQKDFFKKSFPNKEQLRENYCGLLRKSDEFEPLLRSKLTSCQVFLVDSNGSRPGTEQDILPNSHGVPIISINSLWVMAGNRFGVSASTVGLMLWPRVEKGLHDLFHTDLCQDTDVCMVPCPAG